MGTLWVVADTNGELCNQGGWFRTKGECETHIKKTLCSTQENHERYIPVAIKPYEQNDYFVIVNEHGRLEREHGFFTTRRAATTYIDARLDPPANREYDRPATHHARQIARSRAWDSQQG